jgi:D-aminopeptidase
MVFHSTWKLTLQQAKRKCSTLSYISHNYVTPVVGETCDWILNNVNDSALEEENVLPAFSNAGTQKEVLEELNGGGASMTFHCFLVGLERVIVW